MVVEPKHLMDINGDDFGSSWYGFGMTALPKPSNRYAHERSPFVSAELNADLDSDHPSEDALEWLEWSMAEAEADPRPRLSSEELGQRLLAHHEARMRRDAR